MIALEEARVAEKSWKNEAKHYWSYERAMKKKIDNA
jgi:hypothetical protein